MRSSRASMPPPSVQRYRLGAELGRGGMGRVVEAFDTQLGRTVALKEVLPKGGPSVARRFLREVQITARLEHASIVPLYDAGTTPDGRPYYVMRRVSGRPFDELIGRARDLGERMTLLPAMLAAIDAVAHAHGRGVIHRDLKPGNILIADLGETVVIDWGLAKVIGEEDPDTNEPIVPTAADSLQTQLGSVFGTPGFMAPEQARGEELGTHADVYALGATLYHLLTGRPPHAGTSATEVLGSTLAHDVRPLAEAAPGAPPELCAIVDKALAFEQAARYPDAGALGEDVRRFLAGQLVAAHRYTPRQRLSRFARRHRTPLAVAALAVVAVAVLAWFSVHRIVQERDAATAARHAALIEKQQAVMARDRLAERNDALLVTQARSLVDANPTEAIALLKQLDPASRRLADARAIGQAAVTRGVWWAIQGPDELTVRAALSPDGRQLLQRTREGVLRIWDLDRRRLVLARPYPSSVQAVWVSAGRVLVHGSTTAPELLDPAANRSTPLALDLIQHAIPSDTGERVLLHHAVSGHASLYDVASGALVPLWDRRKVHDLALAPDGRWAVLHDRAAVVVFDERGTELARRAGEIDSLAVSRFRTLAVSDGTHVFEGRLDPDPAWTRLPTADAGANAGISAFAYRGAELTLALTSGELLGWFKSRLVRRGLLDGRSSPLMEAAGGVLVVASRGDLAFFGTASGKLPLPTTVGHARLVTHVNHSRIVVIGDGVILGIDLAAIVPRRHPARPGARGIHIDDRTAVISTDFGPDWAWLDLATLARTPVGAPVHGLAVIRDVDASTGRALVIDGGGPRERLVLLQKGAPQRVIAEGPRVWGRLLHRDAVVFTLGAQPADGRVQVQVGSEPVRELVELDGDIRELVSRGAHGFAAISDRGEVVRGTLAGTIERTRIPAGEALGVGSDVRGRVVIMSDDRLLLWEQQVVEIARFAKPIRSVTPVEGDAMVVMLEDNDVHLVAVAPGAAPRRLLGPSQHTPTLSADGRTLVAVANGKQLSIVEVATGARWTLPQVSEGTPTISVAPSARTLLQSTHLDGVLEWTLPTSTPDFPVWLDEQTNAVKEGDGVLAWPWQLRTP